MPTINSEPSSIAKLGPKPGRSRDARTGRHRRSIPTFKKTAIKSHSRENSSHSPTLLSIKHTHNEHRRRLHHLGISFEKRSIRPLSRNTAPTKSRQTIPNIISSSTRHRKQLGEVIPIPAPMSLCYPPQKGTIKSTRLLPWFSLNLYHANSPKHHLKRDTRRKLQDSSTRLPIDTE